MSATSDFYLARASDSARDAAATDLANVRDRCLRSEAAWRAMAERLMRGEVERERVAAEKAGLLGNAA
ncbi:hypothetical protein WG908_09065 [Sphingobium sp. AN641]|uniref:hypothetical protein n=1 Tax=Sphingobium sp. AN641 TaxID=3133443 RepID=UPI0030BABD33